MAAAAAAAAATITAEYFDVLVWRPTVCFFQSLTETELILLVTPATIWLNKCWSQYWTGCSLRVVNNNHDYSINRLIELVKTDLTAVIKIQSIVITILQLHSPVVC